MRIIYGKRRDPDSLIAILGSVFVFIGIFNLFLFSFAGRGYSDSSSVVVRFYTTADPKWQAIAGLMVIVGIIAWVVSFFFSVLVDEE